MTKNGKSTCSCPNGTVSTVKNLKNVCEPATFSTFTAVPDLAMSDDEIARALLNKEPAVRPVDNDDGDSSTAVVLLLFILVLIILCCVFIKCKKTKAGPEIRIRFTKKVYTIPIGKGSVSEEHLVEFRQDASNNGNFVHGTNKPMDTISAKTHHDFVNPIYPASTKARNHYENDMW